MKTEQKILDITVPLSTSLVVWPGHKPPSITRRSDLSKGDHSTNSNLAFGAHAGTHVDAPAHFIPGGSLVDTLDLNLLIGEVLVVDAAQVAALSADILDSFSIPSGTKRVLFRTRNSQRWFNNEPEFNEAYVGITKSGAQWLVDRGVRLVGTDYLSVAAYAENVPAHRVLLGAGIILVETLNLHDVAPGVYELICLPLKISGAEAAPARVVLLSR